MLSVVLVYAGAVELPSPVVIGMTMSYPGKSDSEVPAGLAPGKPEPVPPGSGAPTDGD